MNANTVSTGPAKTILVVDDEPQIRSLLQIYFRSAGFGVIEAECGLKALAIVEQNGIGAVDVLVTDIEMPNMDGITLIERCKQHFPNLRVIVVSASTDKVLPGVGTMVDAFFPKPFAPTVVLNAVANLLQQSSDSGPVDHST